MPAKAASKTASKAEPFELGDQVVKPGTRAQIDLPVARLASGSWTLMPVVVVHGRQPGPTIWVSGAIHGDELNGVEIVRKLIKRLPPRQLRGTVLAVPIVNVFGVTTGSRYLPDRRDLNRSFPGSVRGSLAARVARLFYDQVVSRCSLGLDLHTAANGRCNLPQIRCDTDDPDTRQLAELFSPPILLHSSLRDGSLRAAAREAGVRVLLYEAGEAHRFDEAAIESGVAGCQRVLQHLGMVADAPRPAPRPPLYARTSKWMRASRSGFAHIDVELGQRVEVGQTVARVTDSTGSSEVSVRSRSAGVVIGVLRYALVHRGDALIHVAEVES